MSERRANSLFAQAAVYLVVVAVTSVIAILATSPFAMLQFNRLALYGLAANLIAVPATALIIMPFLLLAMIVMPLGLEELPLVVAGWGIELVLRVAQTVAAWDGAVLLIPSQPAWALPVIVLGGLWLCLWRGPLRVWGVLMIILAAALSPFFAERPHVLISREADAMAVTGPKGELIARQNPDESYEIEQWLRLAGLQDVTPWDSTTLEILSCDVRGCIYRPEAGRVVALLDHPGAAEEDCRLAELVIYRYRLWQNCGRPPFGPLVIDSRVLRGSGGVALYLEDSGWRVETVKATRGARPWTGFEQQEP